MHDIHLSREEIERIATEPCAQSLQDARQRPQGQCSGGSCSSNASDGLDIQAIASADPE